MDLEGREKRRIELEAIRDVSPAQLVAIYRSVHELGDLTPLPDGITWQVIIDAILGREGITRLSDRETRNH